MAMLGYARVSTQAQDPALQLRQLRAGQGRAILHFVVVT
jgi:DNA invertase Pin-like site-specific DNA recombinase